MVLMSFLKYVKESLLIEIILGLVSISQVNVLKYMDWYVKKASSTTFRFRVQKYLSQRISRKSRRIYPCLIDFTSKIFLFIPALLYGAKKVFFRNLLRRADTNYRFFLEWNYCKYTGYCQ